MAVIVDADVTLDAARVEQAATVARETGRMVLPFTHRRSLSRSATVRVLAGHPVETAQVVETQDWNVSTCLAVPRRLWDEAGGMDERFTGWGGEDEAWHAACLALAGVERLPGDVWHFHHDPAPWKDHRSADYRMALGLANRYVNTACPAANRRRPWLMRCPDPAPMRALLSEPRTADQTVVVVLTNGRRDTLAKTLHSIGQMFVGPIGRRVVVADRCRPEVPAGWDVARVDGGGYTRAVTRAFEVAIGSGQPWVAFFEDDFVLNQPVDLAAMQALMAANPQMAQLVLSRQPWYSEEVAAGGVVQAIPGWEERFAQRPGWVEHRAYWSQNPMLTRRSFLAAHPWPQVKGSEREFGRRLFVAEPETTVGILGNVVDPPRCTHIGVERAGRGY